MASIAQRLPRHRQRNTPRPAPRMLAFAGVAAFAICAVAYVSYVLWPRWPDVQVSLDAPALPITISDVTFNVPPAAIRVAVQRRTGIQDRIDLVFLWPSLTPPDPAAKPVPGAAAASPLDRIFVTIAASDGALAPVERRRIIYPRYTVREAQPGPPGLAVLVFRSGTPYQGEDLVYDAAGPEGFFVRCTRDNGPTPGTCLRELRIGGADVTVRFPRAWLEEWRAVAQAIDRVVAGLQPTGR